MASLTQIKQRFWNNDGTLASGGKVYVYLAGTTTLTNSYTDATGSTPNTNPVILDSKGEASIWTNGLVKINVTDSTGTQITGYPVDNVGGTFALLSDLSASSGSSLVGFIQSGTGAVARTVQDKERDIISVFDFMSAAQIADVRAQTSSIDVTTAIQTAITYVQLTKSKLRFPSGNYLVTNSLSIATGTQIEGETEYQYVNGFGIAPKATTITFAPVTQKSLFVADGATTGGFRFHISVKNLFISGNSVRGGATTSLYSFDLQAVIYGHFENIGITGFNTPVKCTSTINNRFVNVYCNGTVSALIYAGSNETTDVWEQCSYWGCPLGVSFLGSSIGVRFSNCLWEQIDTYGMDVAKECQNIIVEGAYAEDSPFTVGATNCMFRVGYTGTALVGNTSLQVIGGTYSGRGVGLTGSFLDCDFAYGVQLIGVQVQRYTNLIKTSANTSNYAVACSGIQMYSITTAYNNILKLSGVLDFQGVNLATGPVAMLNTLQVANFLGQTAGAAVTAGNVGEYISSTVSAVAAPTTGQYKDLTTITLTAGDWDIDLNVEASLNGSTITGVACGLGTVTGNSTTGLVAGDTQANGFPPNAVVDTSMTVSSMRKLISATTTYYVKIYAVYSAGSGPLFSGRVSARRRD